MPSAFVTTKDNDDSITLSVDTNDLKASTSIFINNHLVKTLNDSFQGFFLGTNRGLKNNVITVATHVFKFPATVTESTVSFVLMGAAEVDPDNPNESTKEFNQVATVPHFMIYNFI